MGKHPQGKLQWFQQFSLKRESFPANYGLVDQQYKSTEMLVMLQQTFYRKQLFSTQNMKAFPTDAFPYMVFHENIFEDKQIVSSRTRRPYDFEDKYF